MSIAQEVRRIFEGYDFGPPCGLDNLERAEQELGRPLPAVLREFYQSFDGFLGPTDAAFFYPLYSAMSPPPPRLSASPSSYEARITLPGVLARGRRLWGLRVRFVLGHASGPARRGLPVAPRTRG